jgi:drug/metabolite transporter (DMT)-like permease
MKFDPRYELLTSRVLAALRPVLIAFLVMNGAALGQGSKTPISFCNVLFVGNLCAALVVLFWFKPGPIWRDIQSLSTRVRLGLVLDGGLAALNSALIYIGLEYTSSTNAILLGRLAPVLYALSGAVVFSRLISKREWLGFGFIIAGTLVVALIGSNWMVNKGDTLIILSTVVFAISSILGKAILDQDVSLRALVCVRNGSSSVIFFIVANVVFGPHHFADAFSGRLWIVMVIYALLIIVVAQFLWFDASDQLDSISVGRWATPAPAVGVLVAALLNRQWPASNQLVGLLVIMVGVMITAFGKTKPAKGKQEQEQMAELAANGANVIAPVT